MKVYEGFVHIVPYAGDGVLVHPHPPVSRIRDPERFWEELNKIRKEVREDKGLDLFALISSLEDKYVRVEVGEDEVRIKVVK